MTLPLRRLGDGEALRIAIIIPARLASTRFPAKPLAPIVGPDGLARPAISYTWAAAKAAAAALAGEVECVIATESVRIAEACTSLGMAVVITPEECLNGTERCAAALASLETAPDIVVNIQGDAPLTPAMMVASVVERLLGSQELAMATAVVGATPQVLAHLQADAAAGRVGGTTAVCSRDGRALYFSKSIIPHIPMNIAPVQPVLLHIGLYAYRPQALAEYVAAGPAPLELQEGLEQLRFLDAGMFVGVVVCPSPPWEMIELNNPTDLPFVEAELAKRALAESCQ